jgi:1-aminocyclopropane-1-carboxylate deaminase/D-cysteine desulfhydrase-like pyridoxal-dependent ACC family enzyme
MVSMAAGPHSDAPITDRLGTYPTAVQPLNSLSAPGCELWVKRDDQTHSQYGGNKVRKLEHLLAAARRKGARRLLTIGAAGSHHVLATAVHGRNAGFEVAAVLVPQPLSPGVIETLRAAIGVGLTVYPASTYAQVPVAIARALRRGDYVIPAGGSNVTGSLGYVDAAAELADQIHSGAMPQPDAIVVALGSGGTVAGLLAGAAQLGLQSTIVGVHVVHPWVTSRLFTVALAKATCRRVGCNASVRQLSAALETESSMLGEGYGHSTPAALNALQRAADVGLILDTTYTAKTFAHVLALVQCKRYRRILYWHTLSGAPMPPLLDNAPSEDDVLAELRVLLKSASA